MKFTELSIEAQNRAILEYVLNLNYSMSLKEAHEIHVDYNNEWIFDESGNYIKEIKEAS